MAGLSAFRQASSRSACRQKAQAEAERVARRNVRKVCIDEIKQELLLRDIQAIYADPERAADERVWNRVSSVSVTRRR